MKLKKHLFPIIYTFLLIAFTIYLLLDTFVIVRVYEPVDKGESTTPTFTLPPESSEPEEPSESESDTAPEETKPIITEPIITENSYEDNDISIESGKYFCF